MAVGAPTSHAIVLCVMREESGVSNRQAVKEPPAAMFSSRDVTENKTTWSFFFFPTEIWVLEWKSGRKESLDRQLDGIWNHRSDTLWVCLRRCCQRGEWNLTVLVHGLGFKTE